MKRSPLRPISAKRRAQADARRKCREVVLERDKGCVYFQRVAVLRLVQPSPWPFPIKVATFACCDLLDVHEPAKRSQGADPTDPDQALVLCRVHHDFIHQHPEIGKALGLLV